MTRAWLVFLAIAVGGLSGCSTTARRNVENQVSDQSEIESPHQAVGSGRFAIRQSQKLTEGEKMQFLALIDRTESSVSNIKKREGQLKAALFQSLSQKNYDPEEIEIYKRDLTKLENEKLNLMFSNLDEVRRILKLGKNQGFDSEFLEYYKMSFGY